MKDASSNDGNDGKVVTLFPDRVGAAPREEERGPALDLEDVEAVKREIQGVLNEATRVEPAATEVPNAPDPSHRNAVRCPQCDGYTWRRTPFCRHCGADLSAYAAERRQALLWCAAIASWGVALGCFYLNQHYALPSKLHTVLNVTALSIAAANAFAFWLVSLSEKP
jgi:uncharacterized protein (DUF983 family)